MNTYQPSFFDESERLEKLSKLGDPLVGLQKYINFEQFRAVIEKAQAKERKSAAGRPAYDAVFMFKILILQRLYNLSDEQVEYQINDRQSFQRFLGLHMGDRVPDYSSVWGYRGELAQKGVVKELFTEFARELEKQGVISKAGTIVDASFVEVPRQRNSREENQQIKEGKVPPAWEEQPRKLSQKDLDAKWAKKGGQTHYGYKNHIRADAASALISGYEVSSAAVHDSQKLGELITEANRGESLFGDSAYKSEATDQRLKNQGINNYIHEKGTRAGPLCEVKKQINTVKSRVRALVEHVFGWMENSAGGKKLEYIGIKRISAAIGLLNLAYNMTRLVQLHRLGRVPTTAKAA